LGFAGYTGLILRQAFVVFRAGTGGLFYIPYLLIKMAIMGIAIAYWFPSYCKTLMVLGPAALFVAAGFSLSDAARTLKFVFVDAAHPVAEADDMNIAFALFTTVFCPVVLLYFASKVLYFKQCVAI